MRAGATRERRRQSFDDDAEAFPLTPRSAAHCRTVAARARALQAMTTTPRLKRNLGEMIARYGGQAVDFECNAPQ